MSEELEAFIKSFQNNLACHGFEYLSTTQIIDSLESTKQELLLGSEDGPDEGDGP